MIAALICWTGILCLCQGQGQANLNRSIKGGIIQINTNEKVIVKTDSVLVSLVYDTSEINYMWNNFVEKGERVSNSLENNNCVEQILKEARASRFKIKEYLNERETNVTKRQAIFGATEKFFT